MADNTQSSNDASSTTTTPPPPSQLPHQSSSSLAEKNDADKILEPETMPLDDIQASQPPIDHIVEENTTSTNTSPHTNTTSAPKIFSRTRSTSGGQLARLGSFTKMFSRGVQDPNDANATSTTTPTNTTTNNIQRRNSERKFLRKKSLDGRDNNNASTNANANTNIHNVIRKEQSTIDEENDDSTNKTTIKEVRNSKEQEVNRGEVKDDLNTKDNVVVEKKKKKNPLLVLCCAAPSSTVMTEKNDSASSSSPSSPPRQNMVRRWSSKKRQQQLYHQQQQQQQQDQGKRKEDDSLDEPLQPIPRSESPINLDTDDSKKWLLAPRRTEKKCLVLDLDETLVHSSFKLINQADYIVPVEIESQFHNVYVIKRPGVDAFMKRMGEIYEIVIFTASLSKYADPVLDMLDVHKVVAHRLFRDSCYNHQGNYVKDLGQLGRPLADTLIIDNSPASYIFHPGNAVPITSWFNDPHDSELIDLCPFLEDLSKVVDVGQVLDTTIG